MESKLTILWFSYLIFIGFLCYLATAEDYVGTLFFAIKFYHLPDQAELLWMNYSEMLYSDFYTLKGVGEYKLSFWNETSEIFSDNFGVVFFEYERSENGTIVQNKTSVIKQFRIKIPTGAEYLNIYKGEKLLLSLNLEDYLCDKDGKCEKESGESVYFCRDCVECGDGICSTKFGESPVTCKLDCPSGRSDGMCDGIKDDVCDPDCIEEGFDPDCEANQFNLALIFIFVVAIFVIILFVIHKKQGRLRWKASS